MKVKEFKTTADFENYYESDNYNELVPTIVMEKGYCKADFTTYCKSWKTAVRRARKAFAEYKDVAEWIDGISDSCELGYFSLCEKYNGEYSGGWFYGVEEVSDGVWYIYLSFIYDIDIAEKYRKGGNASMKEEKKEIESIMLALLPEGEEKPVEVEYKNVNSYHVASGSEAAEIEAHTDGSGIDKKHEYLVIIFADGTTSTYRKQSVKELYVTYKDDLERGEQLEPQTANEEKQSRCYAFYTASAESQAASWGGGADDYAEWYNTWKEGAKAAIALARLYPSEEVMMLTFVDGEAEDHPSYYKWNEAKKCVESYTHEVREVLNGNC